MARSAPLERRPMGKPRGGLPLQAKLAVGPARDRYEAEADRVAAHVQRAAPGAAPPAISRLPASAAQRAPAASPPKAEDLEDKVETTKVEDEEDKSTAVQRSAEGPAAAPASAEAAIGRMRSAGGTPLGPTARSQMESGFGRPLGHVRVHDGAPAARAARDVGARAFTVGNDIFFGAGQYRPDTAAGQHLLAHELTHTEQQKGLTGAGQRLPLQRDPTDPDPPQTDPPQTGTPTPPGATAAPTEFIAGGDTGRVRLRTANGLGGTLYIPAISIPTVLGSPKGTYDGDPGTRPTGRPHVYAGRPDQSIRATGGGASSTPGMAAPAFTFVRQSDRAAESAASRWRTRVGARPAEQFAAQVRDWGRNAATPIQSGSEEVHFLRLRSDRASSASTLLIAGTPSQLATSPNLQIPVWSQGGNYIESGMQVDHFQEIQLGGLDDIANFWLYAGTANMSSGGTISAEFERRITRLLNAAPERFWTDAGGRKPSFDTVKWDPNWTVEFAQITGRSIRMQTTNAWWTLTQLLEGLHLQQLREMSVDEVAREGLITQLPGGGMPTPSVISVFTGETGGFRRRFRVAGNGANVTPFNSNEGFFPGFDLVSADVNADPAAVPRVTGLNGWMFRRRRGRAIDPILFGGDRRLIVNPSPAFGFGGYIRPAQIYENLRAVEANIFGASPITFTEAGIDQYGAIYANGVITATKLLFPRLEIPIFIRGSDIFVEFPIPTESLSFGPLRVTEAALALGVGDNGIFVSGSTGLELASVGSGLVTARVESGNTILRGTFNFDLDFLDPAQASVTYDYNRDLLTVALTAGVQRGRLPGIEFGQVTVSISRESASVSGELRPAGALAGTVVTIGYTTEGGLVVGAENIPLPVESIPGVNSATASLHARRDPTTGEWSFGGAGTAELGIAGATGSVSIAVDGPKVTFGGNLNVAHGPASGSISFTATNAPMDEGGNIIDGPPTATFTVFGRGRAEITFGQILKGSAEIELSPDASITIRGAIGLPPTFEVFPRSEYNKTLFTIETPDFPIWGVSVAGVGIGIFGFADASLSFNAFVGPGQLVDTQVAAVMDLDHPEDATITGSAGFTVPAYAGLKLDIGGGLRARVAVAYVEGRVGLDAELGIAAEASAGVDIAWNRNDGLSVAAEIKADAQPKFRVGVNASVTVGVDLWLTEIEKTWGPWRRTLGEFGPEMGLGITVPVKWSEQNGLGFSTDDIQIRYPQISVVDILKSSFEELV